MSLRMGLAWDKPGNQTSWRGVWESDQMERSLGIRPAGEESGIQTSWGGVWDSDQLERSLGFRPAGEESGKESGNEASMYYKPHALNVKLCNRFAW